MPTIHIIAPAYGCSHDKLEQVKQLLKKEFPDHIIKCASDIMTAESLAMTGPINRVANTAKNRAKVIVNALEEAAANENTNNQRDILWCITGGNGSTGTVAALQQYQQSCLEKGESGIARTSALVIGFSDACTTLNYLGEMGFATPVFGSDLLNLFDLLMPDFKEPEVLQQELSALKAIINDSDYSCHYNKLTALNKTAKKIKNISGTIIGGTISSIYCSIGTTWEMNTKNRIVFLEGVTEPFELLPLKELLYHESFFTKLTQAKAVVFGDFSPLSLKKPLDKSDYDYIDNIIKKFGEALNKFNVPVISGVPCGHAGTNTAGFSGKSMPIPLFVDAVIAQDNAKAINLSIATKPISCLYQSIYPNKKQISLKLIADIETWEMTQLHLAIGTQQQPCLKNKFLKINIEQSQRKQPLQLAHLDIFMRRTFNHYLQSGLLDEIKGLIIGHVALPDFEQQPTQDELNNFIENFFEDFAREKQFKFPVLKCL